MIKRLSIVLVLTLAAAAYADEPVHAAAPAAHPHPVLPENPAWAGVMVIVILVGLFLPAAVIGPIAKALAPEDEPVTHSHDEPPGASHHHGPEGTRDAGH